MKDRTAQNPQHDPSQSGPSPAFFTGDAELDKKNIEILLKTIATVNSAASHKETLSAIVDGAIELTKTERGILFLFDEFDKLRVRVSRDASGTDLPGDIQFSRGIPKKVITEGKPIYSVVTSDEEAFELGTSVMELKLRAVMCVPLVNASKKVIGAVYVDSKAGAREFTDLDLSLFESLAQQVTVSLERLRAQELESAMNVAREIQKHLLTADEVVIPGLDVRSLSMACDETNGDYHDLFRLSDTRLGIAVGDVTGHGIGPALLVARTQAFLEAYVEQEQDPGQLVFRLNNVIESHTKDDNFVTLFYSEIDAANRKLSYSSAGHPPALLVRAATGEIEEFPKTGVPLGIQADFPFRKNEDIELDVGDVLLIYTDGVTESMNAEREMFGDDRLRQTLKELASLEAEQISKGLLDRVREFTGSARLQDDLTWVVARVTPQ